MVGIAMALAVQSFIIAVGIKVTAYQGSWVAIFMVEASQVHHQPVVNSHR